MKARKYLVERIIIEDATDAELVELQNNGFEYDGDETFYGEKIFEKITECE